jgi:hypothetical protein
MRFVVLTVLVAAWLLEGCASMSAPTGLPMSLSVPPGGSDVGWSGWGGGGGYGR